MLVFACTMYQQDTYNSCVLSVHAKTNTFKMLDLPLYRITSYLYIPYNVK